MNQWTIKARSFARRTGLIRLIHTLRPDRPYEDKFHQGLEAAVKPGDTVWDVGANVGLYTEMFRDWVGPSGHVVAVEPMPESIEAIHERLEQSLPGCDWVRLENVALSDTDTQARFMLTGDSTTHHLASAADTAGSEAKHITVQVWRGDKLCEMLGRVPNVIKIDVEGFEEEVLKGLDQTLLRPELRSLLVEVHFKVLEARGQATAPLRIEKMLRAKGFAVEWLDASHLAATR